MSSHQDMRLLRYFVEIVRAGSIRRAAEALRLSPAVLSEALTRLETTLGVTLLRRTTRSMRLTAVGEAVFRRAAEMTSAADDAFRIGRGVADAPSGTLRLTLSGELCLSWLPDKLRAFQAAFPAVEVDVAIDDDPVDLAQSPFDIAVRAAFARAPREGPEVVGHMPLACVCAPNLIRDGETLETLLGRIGLIGSSSSEIRNRAIWVAEIDGPRRAWSQIAAPCRFHSSQHVVSHRLALEGFGAALLMRPTVTADLAAGRLCSVSGAHDFGYATVSTKLRDAHPTAAAREMSAWLRR